MCSCGNEEGCIGFEVGCRCVCHHSEALSLIDKLHLQVSKEEQMKFAARDATIAVQKKLDETLLQNRDYREALERIAEGQHNPIKCVGECRCLEKIAEEALKEKRVDEQIQPAKDHGIHTHLCNVCSLVFPCSSIGPCQKVYRAGCCPRCSEV